MPRAAKSGPPTMRVGNLQYVDPVLSESQKSDLLSWASGLTAEVLLQSVAEITEGGFGVTIKKSDTGGMCSLSPQGDDHKYSGKLLISRASSPVAALKVAVFKHFYVLKEEWPDSPRGSFDL